MQPEIWLCSQMFPLWKQNVLLSIVLKLTGASKWTIYPDRQSVWGYSIQFLILSTSKFSQKTRNLISPSRPQIRPRCLSTFCCVQHCIRSDQSQREHPDVLKVSFFLWLIKGLLSHWEPGSHAGCTVCVTGVLVHFRSTCLQVEMSRKLPLTFIHSP